jgi:UDP-N-acetylmuramoyl-L-alanyl-D-glutamate--2,6-diaminopimelate ligase
MGKIAAELADITVICNDNPRTEDPMTIINMIVAGIPESHLHKISVMPDRAKAIEKAAKLSKEGDIVLVAGKGHETYQIIGTTKHHFDDREELRRY